MENNFRHTNRPAFHLGRLGGESFLKVKVIIQTVGTDMSKFFVFFTPRTALITNNSKRENSILICYEALVGSIKMA